MRKNKDIVRYTAREIDDMRRQDKDHTDVAKLAAMSEAELAKAIADDDEGEFDWAHAEIGIPQSKRQLTLRLDAEVVDWFKSQGRGYQTRMNTVLRRFVDAQKSRHR